jgi:galactosamine-6-phosphate isomerase
MKLEQFDDYDRMSQKAKELIVEELSEKKNTLLCAATGKSPTKIYELLENEFEHQPELFSELRIVKLDEWGNIAMDHPKTCEYYLQNHLIAPLKIPQNRYISFLSNSDDPNAECKRVQAEINRNGGIDLCILGLGMNGHIALNEPADFLQAHCHVANISEVTLQHPMASGMQKKPAFGFTLGMADILQSRKILILIHGINKSAIANEFLSGRISTRIPASFLWLHPNVICLADVGILNQDK